MATQQSMTNNPSTNGNNSGATVTLPIGNYTGVFDLQLLLAVKSARNVSFTVHKAMRQERDFAELSKYTSEFVIGKNGPGFGFTLVLDNKPYFVSPPVWANENDVRSSVPEFLERVKSLPLLSNTQQSGSSSSGSAMTTPV